jgi:transcription antitermination protein NusB
MKVLAERVRRADPPVNPYTTDLVVGVTDHRGRIDELLATYSVGWTLDRMPAVDRNILRLGTYELLWAEDIPDAVAVAEAVGLARELSTDESPTFVNGLLSRIFELKPTLSR